MANSVLSIKNKSDIWKKKVMISCTKSATMTELGALHCGVRGNGVAADSSKVLPSREFDFEFKTWNLKDLYGMY